jgi:hypothetical protein
MAAGERAELATEEYIPLSPVSRWDESLKTESLKDER